MNKMTSAVATAALAVGAVAIAAGTATAAPVTTAPVASNTHTIVVNPAVAPAVHHAASVEAVSAQVKPASAPRTAALIGSAAVQNTAHPALKDIDWTADFNSDLSVAATQFGLATGLGGMIGGITGVVLGCPIGAATGGLLFAAEAATGGLGLLAGCITGAATLGTLGPVIGGAILGVPVGIASAVQMYNTMHAAHEISAPMAVAQH